AVGGGGAVAGGVVGRARLGAVGKVRLDELAAGVVDEHGAMAQRIDRRGLIAVGIVFRPGRVPLGVGGGRHPAVGVVGRRRDQGMAAHRRCLGELVAVGVVRVGRGVAEG